jgi:protease-4
LQGVRRGIERLRQAGKKVWVHLNSPGLHEYYLASAADHISLTPAATLDIAGLSAEAVFFFGALEKVGIEPEVVQMGRYKAAGETFTRRDMSGPHREMIESLVDDLYGQIIDDVAAGRQMTPDAVRTLFDRGPFLPAEARDTGLVDALAYEDEIEKRCIAACGDSATIERRDYVRRRGRELRSRVLRSDRGSIAVLHISGTIKSGDSIPGPDGAAAAGAASLAAALKDIRERENVRGVLLRVASPGGSGAASDLIWHELVRTRERKPIVVSCGDVAASGGYYVALATTPIFAEPGTITGSIGVVAGRATLRRLYDRLGVTKERVSRGRHAALYSDYAPLGEEERGRIKAEAESFYDSFVDKVAAGRQLKHDVVATVAEGRVWTGRQAWSRGLVDQLGDLEDALDALKTTLGVSPDEPMAVERFPRPRRLFKLSLDLNVPGPHAAAFGELLGLLGRFEWLQRERVWALLPFTMRFR